MYVVYILYSKSTDHYYVGQTDNLDRRLTQHNSGYSKSTKKGIPWELLCTEEYFDRSAAIYRESIIKAKKSRKYIVNLLTGIASR